MGKAMQSKSTTKQTEDTKKKMICFPVFFVFFFIRRRKISVGGLTGGTF